MVHEAGETARSFFQVMGTQPLALALIISNFALIGYLYYEGANVNAQRKAELELLYSNRREVAILLARCHWPEGVPLPDLKDMRLQLEE